jgi:hypothetical protein
MYFLDTSKCTGMPLLKRGFTMLNIISLIAPWQQPVAEPNDITLHIFLYDSLTIPIGVGAILY